MKVLGTILTVVVMHFHAVGLCAQEEWEVPEDNVSTQYARYVNEAVKRSPRGGPPGGGLYDMPEAHVRKMVPRYAHLINSISPVQGSKSRSWYFDPMKDPDHMVEGNYYIAAKRNIDNLKQVPTEGRRQLVFATFKGNDKDFLVRIFDNTADKYKDYKLKQQDFKDELTMLDKYRWLERRINHKWSKWQVEELIETLATKTGHKLDDGLVFPNRAFEEKHKMKVEVYSGDWVEIPYFQNEKGDKFFLSCALDYARWEWVKDQIRYKSIKSRWLNEKDPQKKEKYKRIIIAFADRYAEALPKLVACKNDTGVDGRAPMNWSDAKRGGSLIDTRYGFPTIVLDGLVNPIHDEAPEWFNAKRPGTGGKTNGQFLAGNVIMPPFERATTGSERGWEVGNVDINGTGYYMRTACDYDVVEVAQWTYSILLRILKRYNLSADGFGGEGWSYFHLWRAQRVGPAHRALRHATLSDQKLMADIERLIDNVHMARVARSEYGYSFPDGSIMGNGSAHVRKGGNRGRWSKSYHASSNTAMPSSSVFRMGDGEGDRQVQAAIMNTFGCNHSHDFPMNLLLFANGYPIYSDNSQYGGYLSSHNTAAFDRRENSCRNNIGEFDYYAPRMPGIAAVRVSRHIEDDMGFLRLEDARNKGLTLPPLPIQAKAHNRTLIHNTVDLKHPYVVDVFEMEGGKFHDYHLHGMNAWAMQSCKEGLSPSLKKDLDTKTKKSHQDRWGRKLDGYSDRPLEYINCASTLLKEDGYLDMRYIDKPELGVRIHLQADPEIKLWATDRSNSSIHWDYLKKNPYPQLVLEHGDPTLKAPGVCRTVFVVLHEPLNGKSAIKRFKHREINGGKALSIEVTMTGGRKDRYLVSLEKTQQMAHGDLKATAQMAAACTKGGKSDLWLVSGKDVSIPGRTLKAMEPNLGPAEIREITTREERGQEDSILTDMDLPVGDVMAGQFVIIRFFDPIKDLMGRPSDEEYPNELVFDWKFKNKHDWHRAYEIDHIRQEGEYRRIVLRNYANVLWDKTLKAWQLQYMKRAAFRKAELFFKNQISTVPMVEYTPRMIYDPAANNNFLVSDGNALKINVRTRPPGAPVVGAFGHSKPDGQSSRVRESFTLTRSGTLRLKALNPDGMMQPRSIASDYLIGRLPARKLSKSKLKPGLALIEMVEKKKRKTRVIESATFSTHYPSTRGPETLPVMVQGYIDVPKSGITEFGFFSNHLSKQWRVEYPRLHIDGHELIDAHWIQGLARMRENIPLEKGLHRIRLNGHSDEMRLYWKLPGAQKMVPVPKSAFYHDFSQTEAGPVAVIRADSRTCRAGSEVNFDGSASYGVIEHMKVFNMIDERLVVEPCPVGSYEWKIDGKLVSTEARFSHVFSKRGTYTVSLEVKDTQGEPSSEDRIAFATKLGK